MSSSANEDREQRETENVEKSDLMTIEFLRARLLSERSVSKTARERADELANRVAELEEQLKFVSLQREKAEKATSDILVILKNHEIGDVSEEFDSSSEQEENSQDFEARNGSLTMEETSTNSKSRNNEKEAYSSSEIESSPSTGRSLSWKSTRDSQHSLEKKKYIDPIRRRASFSSNGSSSRRVGKSCRRIRRRDTRSVDELQNDGIEKTTNSRGSSNCSNGDAVASPENSGYANGRSPPETPVSGRSDGTQKVNGHYLNVPEKDENMESALLHQAQLICRYEEEEKAQREWEEKFRESNSGTQDSCDPGNYSDVTEERYETKSPEPPRAPVTLDSDDQEVKQQPADASLTEPRQTTKVSPPAADDVKASLQEENSRTTIAPPESSASEFSFPKSEKILEDFSRRKDETSGHRSQQYPPTVSQIQHAPPSGGSSSFELAVVPQETSRSLGTVLGACQHAKLSLSEKLSSLPHVPEVKPAVPPSNAYTNTVDAFQIPFGTPGLFRLPTDYQDEATGLVNTGIGARPSFANFPHDQYEATGRVNTGIGAQPSFANFPHDQYEASSRVSTGIGERPSFASFLHDQYEASSRVSTGIGERPSFASFPHDQYEATGRISTGIGARPSFASFPHDQYEAIGRVSTGIGAGPSFANFPHDQFAGDRFLTEPRSNLFHSVPSRSLTPETRSAAAPPPRRFLSQPQLGGGAPIPVPSTSTNHLDPLAPPPQELYPFFPSISLPNFPPGEEGISRTSLGSEKGLPPFMRLSSYSLGSEKGLPPVMRLSSYDGNAGPSMYR